MGERNNYIERKRDRWGKVGVGRVKEIGREIYSEGWREKEVDRERERKKDDNQLCSSGAALSLEYV